MSKNLNGKYKKTIDFLQNMSLPLFHEFGIKIEIEVLNNVGLNAMVQRTKDNTYRISFYSGCFNLDYSIERITTEYKEDDLIFFRRFKKLRAFECYEDDTYREELNNLFATMIVLHIFYHECGHILAGHVEGSNEKYLEFDSKLIENYGNQEREMVADWLSTKLVYQSIFNSIGGNSTDDFEEFVKIFRSMTVLYWLSLTIEFQIFDSNHIKKNVDFSKMTHPHPAVRLFYNIDAMREAMVDIFSDSTDSIDLAIHTVDIFSEDFYLFIGGFINITDAPIDIQKDESEIFDWYIKLRNIPYEAGIEMNDCLHLPPLPVGAEHERYRNYSKFLLNRLDQLYEE